MDNTNQMKFITALRPDANKILNKRSITLYLAGCLYTYKHICTYIHTHKPIYVYNRETISTMVSRNT